MLLREERDPQENSPATKCGVSLGCGSNTNSPLAIGGSSSGFSIRCPSSYTDFVISWRANYDSPSNKRWTVKSAEVNIAAAPDDYKPPDI